MVAQMSKAKALLSLVLAVAILVLCSLAAPVTAQAATVEAKPFAVHMLLGLDGDQEMGAMAILYGKAANKPADNYAVLIKIHTKREALAVSIISGEELDALSRQAVFSSKSDTSILQDLDDDLDVMEELDVAYYAEVTSQIQKAIAAGKVSVTLKDCPWLLPDTLKMAAAAGEDFKIQCDNMDDGAVKVRLTVTPSKATRGIVTFASVDDDVVGDIVERYERLYTNKFSAIYLLQEGSFGASVKVSAKVGLKGLNTDSLRFYSYNPVTNKHTELENVKYAMDDKGYLTFYTSRGGVILITDKALDKK